MRKALYILGELTDEDIVWMATVGERLAIPPATTLIHAGMPIDHLYLVIEGQLSVRADPSHVIAELGPGDILGEMSLVEKRPPSVSVLSESACELLAIPQAALAAELASNLGLAARFYRALAIFLSDRLRGTVSRLGYGVQDPGTESDDVDAVFSGLYDDAELDEVILDNLTLAGDRLRRLVEMVGR